MLSQKELLDSAKKIDQRLEKAKTVIKSHNKRKTAASKNAVTEKAKQEARQVGKLI